MNLIRIILALLNKLIPKFNSILLIGNNAIESNTVALARYLSKNNEKTVFLVISKQYKKIAMEILPPEIRMVQKSGIEYAYRLITSKYVFFTFGNPLPFHSKRQKVTNIWHGIPFKTIGLLNGEKPKHAHLTVATSDIIKNIFTKAFGVTENSVIITGYPRNDILIKANRNKEVTRRKLGHGYTHFEEYFIWMPTYREKKNIENYRDGKVYNNPFNLRDFNAEKFNKVLKDLNAVCFIKPHPSAVLHPLQKEYSNLIFIDDKWISSKKITLYDLVGCTDCLISDFSSIMADYLLLDQPVLCVSDDLEEYRKRRGFCFENIEEWLPAEIISNQEIFYQTIKDLVINRKDNNHERRLRLKALLFEDFDEKSSERLIDYVFSTVS